MTAVRDDYLTVFGVDIEAITPDTAADALRRLVDRCDELDAREPAWRYLTTAQIRAEIAEVLR